MTKYFLSLLLLASSCNKNAVVDVAPIDLKGQILFISRRIPNNPEWQMFLMNADGTNQKAVVNSLVRCTPPKLSNDGKKIAFTTYDASFYYNLYVVDIDGQNERLLSKSKEYCGSPSWSPDNSNIAFVKREDIANSNYNIFSIKIDGTNEKKLTTSYDNFSPQYLSNTTIILSSSSINGWSGIYKMNADGGGQTLLTPYHQSFADPKISPDKQKIVITSVDWNGSQVYVMNVNGSNLKQLTFSVSPSHFDIGFPRDGNSTPEWSPNSKLIAYVSYQSGNPDVCIVNADGTGSKKLTSSPLRDENPCWTPDGKYILFSSNRNMDVSSEIYIMRTGGQLQTPLTNYRSDDIFPSFIRQ